MNHANKGYDPQEQEDIISIFAAMLMKPTKNGGEKRAAGKKVSWKIDTEHEAALFSHLNRWKHGEIQDPESRCHPLIHLAWRALAIAWQEETAAKLKEDKGFDC